MVLEKPGPAIFADPPVVDKELQMLGPIVLTSVLGSYLCVCFFLALLCRLFKMSLCLVMVYTILFVVGLFRGEYFGFEGPVPVVLEGVIIFFLFQGVIGVRREKLEQSTKVDVDNTPLDPRQRSK